MKKRVLLGLLAALLAMSLAACGGKETNNSNSTGDDGQNNQQDTAGQPDNNPSPAEPEDEDLPEGEQTTEPDTGSADAGDSSPEEGTVPAGNDAAPADTAGGEPDQEVTGTSIAAAPSLSSFFDTLAASYEGLGSLGPLEGELLDAYYPGLSALPVKEMLVQETMMSTQNCAVALVTLSDGASEQDITAVQDILSARIKTQAEGGAFYPASCEVWENGVVKAEGKTVGMFVYDGAVKEMADTFMDTFKN